MPWADFLAHFHRLGVGVRVGIGFGFGAGSGAGAGWNPNPNPHPNPHPRHSVDVCKAHEGWHTTSVRTCPVSHPEGSASRGYLLVIGHDVRSFHPGQVSGALPAGGGCGAAVELTVSERTWCSP